MEGYARSALPVFQRFRHIAIQRRRIAQGDAQLRLGALGLDEGDALQTLERDLPESIDLVLLDGAKGLYPSILAMLESRLREGALIVADNANWSPEYLAKVRAPAQGYMSVPFAEDVELSLKVH